MSGGGLGGTLGSLAGAALAPETGGLSIAIPALAGAGGAYLGGSLTGSKNPLMDALLGGIGGGLGGAAGLGKSLGISNVGGVGDDIAGGLPSWLGGASGATDAYGAAMAGNEALSPALAQAMGGANTGVNAATDSLVNSLAKPASSGIAGYLAKQSPLNLALAGGSILSGVDSLMPHKQVDVAQNRANVLSSDPNFSGQLPKYAMQNTATPYGGNWYTYGETPQNPMYNAQPQKLAHGGMVKGYAAGGPIMPGSQPSPVPVNPLTINAAHTVGVAIGKHLKDKMKTPAGQVQGEGSGQADLVPAKLSQGEYIVPADVVSHLGDGATNAGGKALDHLVKKVRHQKSGKGFPPKAKNPLSYLPKKAKA